MKSFYLTDTGKVRDHNEDSVIIVKNKYVSESSFPKASAMECDRFYEGGFIELILSFFKK